MTDTRGPADRDTTALAVAILWDGHYNTTYLRSVNGAGSYFAVEPAEIKRRVLEATRWLLERDLVRLYSVDTSRPPEEVRIPWTGSPDEQIARLAAIYSNESADWEEWGFACWFQNTEAGNALAEANPPEPWTDDDD